MRAVEAKRENKADSALARQPLPVAEFPMESGARNLNQPDRLPMADENRTSGRVPPRNWRLLSQERDRVAVSTARGTVRPSHAQHHRVPRRVRGNGRISRRTGVDVRGRFAQPGRQPVSGRLASEVELRRQCPLHLTIARTFADFCLTHEIDHYTQWLAGRENKVADMLSRDFTLDKQQITKLIRLHGSPLVLP